MNAFTSLLEKAKKRGVTYTSLDAMKLFAIVNMTADHLGAYFFPDHIGHMLLPDHLWWRAIGRITFPVWFFLVGFSRSREIPRSLWVYAAILVVDHLFVGMSLLPMNALISVILSRMLLNWCEDKGWLPNRLPELMAACVLTSIFATALFEYGTMAFLYALVGRMVYTKQKKHFLALCIVSYITFIAFQLMWFKFTPLQAAYVILGTGGVVWWLARCPIYTVVSDWTRTRTGILLTMLSRNTLPYYFYHRLIFEIISAVTVRHALGFAFRL